jgi:DNA integrity scanning protein DisA with diadenylate cyclase activity/mannitol/fructose-specific phosphotransferase system IIA component (Ntr-type)
MATKLSDYLSSKLVIRLSSRDKESALRELTKAAAETEEDIDAERLYRDVMRREEESSSWIAPGVALPSARIDWKGKYLVVVGRSKGGVDYHTPDGSAVHLIVLLVANKEDKEGYLSVFSELEKKLREKEIRKFIEMARDPRTVVAVMSGKKEPRSASSLERYRLSQQLLMHSIAIADDVNAAAILITADAIDEWRMIDWKECNREVLLLTRRSAELFKNMPCKREVISIPDVAVSRDDQVRVGLLLAYARGKLKGGDRVVCISGVAYSGLWDTVSIERVSGRLGSMLQYPRSGSTLSERPEVLERVIDLASEIAAEGREGVHLGTAFVIAKPGKIRGLYTQMILNPFQGYPEDRRNILDPSLSGTIKELAWLDGAFILRPDGVILSAGAHLRARSIAPDIPAGLGSRHRAAANITVDTGAISVVVSASTNMVTVFAEGSLILQLRPRERSFAPPPSA